MKLSEKFLIGATTGIYNEDLFYAAIVEENGDFYLSYNVPGEIMETKTFKSIGQAYEVYKKLLKQHDPGGQMLAFHFSGGAAPCLDD